MSVRGLSALSGLPSSSSSSSCGGGRHSDLGEFVRESYGIPMRARMIHPPPKEEGGEVKTYPVPYGKDGQVSLRQKPIIFEFFKQ